MSLDTVTLDDALRLLSLPRVVGVDPADGEEITAQNGRYGPYLKKGTDSRSLDERGAAVRRSPSTRRWRSTRSRSSGAAAAAAPPLRELGADPASAASRSWSRTAGSAPYVTDGETNATLRKGDDRRDRSRSSAAAELLAEKRARGRRRRGAQGRQEDDHRKTTAKKTAAKKTTAKKAASKAAPKAAGTA